MKILLNEQIGYLQDCVVKCMKCAENNNGAKLYFVNVFPYNQDCHCCGKIIVEGQSLDWGQMFPDMRF